MAVVGSAYVMVRAITTSVPKDIQNAFKGIGGIGAKQGSQLAKGFNDGFRRGNAFQNVQDGLRQIAPGAEAARARFQSLVRTGYTLSTALGVVVSSIGSVLTGIVALGGALLSAVPAAAALLGAITGLGIGLIAARMALGGVGEAVAKLNKGGADNTAALRAEKDAEKALALTIERNRESLVKANKAVNNSKESLTKAQEKLTKALQEGQEELQQLGFDAEDAALAEKKAVIELEKARETLLRVQDLPPNSRARREAELAFAEADLNLRKAKDRNSDLAKEQERLASTGVEGLDSVISAREAEQQAQERLQDARDERSKTERDAARSELDAVERLQRAREDLRKGGGSDPLEGLTASQKEFAKFLATLKPELDKLKEAAASGFLPLLKEAIEDIVANAFPVFEAGLKSVGTSLGLASKSVASAITDAENLSDLSVVFETSGFVIEGFGKILGNLYDSVLSILVAADEQTRRFVTFLETKTSAWKDFLDTRQADGRLKEFFDRAGDIAAQIGAILGNTFGGIFGVIEANTGPGSGGQILLDYFERITENFETWSKTDEARNFFAESAKNAESILSSVGAFVGEILKAGADPNIRVFWDTLKEAAPIFGEILAKLNEAGPAFAELIVSFLEFVNLTLEAGAITVFFDTLRTALDFINNLLRNEAVAAFFEFTAKILAFLSAVGLIWSAISFGVNVVIGAFQALIGIGGSVLSVFSFIAAHPIVIAIGVIAAVITLLIIEFVKLYKSSETFRAFIDGALAAALGFFKQLWDNLVESLKPLIEAVLRLWDTLKVILMPIFAIIAGIIAVTIIAAFQTIGFIINTLIIPAITFLVERLNYLLTPIKLVFEFLGTLGKAFIQLKKDGDIGKFFQTVWNGILTFFKGIINNMIGYFESFVNFFVDGINGIIRGINSVIALGGKAAEALGIRKLNTFDRVRFPRLAEGGVVRPSVGGTLALIGEAGRSERVEPLDPDGLSRRDKALIKELVGPGSSGSGMVINVYPSQGMDEAELANMISRKIAFMTRRGAVA